MQGPYQMLSKYDEWNGNESCPSESVAIGLYKSLEFEKRKFSREKKMEIGKNQENRPCVYWCM